jgi:hypothetical protein
MILDIDVSSKLQASRPNRAAFVSRTRCCIAQFILERHTIPNCYPVDGRRWMYLRGMSFLCVGSCDVDFIAQYSMNSALTEVRAHNLPAHSMDRGQFGRGLGLEFGCSKTPTRGVPSHTQPCNLIDNKVCAGYLQTSKMWEVDIPTVRR